MRKIIYIIIGLSAFGCYHPDYLKINDLLGYTNKDMSKNLYCVDTCFKINWDNYLIISSPQRKHAFIIPKCMWNNDFTFERDIIENTSSFILDNEMAVSHSPCLFWREVATPKDYNILGDTWSDSPQLIPDSDSLSINTYRTYYYSVYPTHFYLLLIRKDVYGMMTRCGIDYSKYSVLDYNHDSGYVKLVVPVWKEKFWKK